MRTRKPVKVLYKEFFENESAAKRREIEIKKLSRKNKLQLIRK